MKNYLIIPAMPTPNGPLHLGHIGGPYLRADILARHLRQQGHHVKVMSGTDNFENYAYRQAVKESLPPLAICNKYHPQIAADLKTMNIHCDEFINPHTQPWHEKYRSWCFRLLEEAQSAGHVREHDGHLQLKMPQNADLQGRGINPPLIHAYQRFLSESQSLNQLTSDCDWGFQLTADKTLLSYGFIYAYYQMLLEHAALTDATVIATFGVDNTVPVLASVLGFSDVHPDYKPVDYYLVNYFYYVNGKKFSTSTRHAIWVTDILGTNISIDILRLFLAGIDVSTAPGNFSFEEFLQFHDALQQQLRRLIHPPVRRTASHPYPGSEDFFRKIDAALQPAQFRPHLAVQAIIEWLQLGEAIAADSADYAGWLKTLAEGAGPFMPDLSANIFTWLEEERLCSNMM